MTGDTTHVASGGVMHNSTKWLAVTNFGGCYASQLFFGGHIASVLHFQGPKNFSSREFFERSVADTLDNFSEQKIIDVAVTKCCSRWSLEHFFAGFFDCGLL